MFQIRNNVFETNSSSTHSICISKAPVPKRRFGGKMRFHIGDFGWGCNCVDPADYLYTAILVCKTEPDECINEIKHVMGKLGIECEFEEPEFAEYYGCRYLDNGGIDHGDECIEFINAVMSDEDRLIRYLLGDSCVFTGNYNCDCCDKYAKCCISDSHKWVETVPHWVPNPDHDEEQYEYYYKGN